MRPREALNHCEPLIDSSAEWRVLVLGNDTQLHARPATPIQLIHACLAYGFGFVAPASWGDELVAMRVAMDARRATAGGGTVLLDHCPMVGNAIAGAGSVVAHLRHVAPPVAAARYLRAAYPDRRVHVTYAGACPGATAPDIDSAIHPQALLRMLLDAGIVVTEQPVLFDSIFPPDRGRYASEPGGAPNANWLNAELGGLVVGVAPETITPVVRALPPGACVLLDAALAVGCNCARARAQLARLEPPRASQAVVLSDLAGDLRCLDVSPSAARPPLELPDAVATEEADYWVRSVPRTTPELAASSSVAALSMDAAVATADVTLTEPAAANWPDQDALGWFDAAPAAPRPGLLEEELFLPDLSEWSTPRSALPDAGRLQEDASGPELPVEEPSPEITAVIQRPPRTGQRAPGTDPDVRSELRASNDRFGFAAAERRTGVARTTDQSRGRAIAASPTRRRWIAYLALGIIGLILGFLTPGLILPGLRAWLPAWARWAPPTLESPPLIPPRDTSSLRTAPWEPAASDSDSTSRNTGRLPQGAPDSSSTPTPQHSYSE